MWWNTQGLIFTTSEISQSKTKLASNDHRNTVCPPYTLSDRCLHLNFFALYGSNYWSHFAIQWVSWWPRRRALCRTARVTSWSAASRRAAPWRCTHCSRAKCASEAPSRSPHGSRCTSSSSPTRLRHGTPHHTTTSFLSTNAHFLESLTRTQFDWNSHSTRISYHWSTCIPTRCVCPLIWAIALNFPIVHSTHDDNDCWLLI